MEHNGFELSELAEIKFVQLSWQLGHSRNT